jgi:hypothetical protein
MVARGGPAGAAELPERSEGKGRLRSQVNGFASLTLRAHCVRLSARRASVEPPTRGFSVFSYVCPLSSRLIYMC